MKINEAIKFSKEQSEIFRGDMGEFLDSCVTWLEELKAYRDQHFALCERHCVNTVEDIYDRALYDYTERLKDKCGLVKIAYDGENKNFEEHVCYRSDIDETLQEMKLD